MLRTVARVTHSRPLLNNSNAICTRFPRSLTTKTTITDLSTGKTIILADPSRPELGDYVNPPAIYSQTRSPYAKYDDPQNRRNLNDPVHFEVDMYDMWSPDRFDYVDDKTALKHNALFFGLFIGVALGISYAQLNPEKPAMPRSYPYGGLAQELGSGKSSDDEFYRVAPDLTADENGILTADSLAEEQKRAYEKENADFINA